MDQRLDRLLAAAAPTVSCPADRVVELERIVAETEIQVFAATRRLQIGRRLCLVVLTLVVSVGSAVGVAEASAALRQGDHTVHPSHRGTSTASFQPVSGHGAK